MEQPNKSRRKLILAKTTLALLTRKELHQVVGGFGHSCHINSCNQDGGDGGGGDGGGTSATSL